MTKYDILLNAIDQLRKEAPITHKRYYPDESDIEKLNQARARAYIHLFLKVKFGILDFSERENLIVDDNQDGGIDAYYIDNDSKRIFFLQSKFRNSEINFNEKEITFEDLLKMDIGRILKGENFDENGVEYNSKVKKMVSEIKGIPDIGRFQYEVVILANVKVITQTNLKKLSGGFPVSIVNNECAYKDLLLPLIKGTYFNPGELILSINLANVDSAYSRIDYLVKTRFRDCTITVVFVPTLEIAQVMKKYKNSILQFNPRSFLELSRNNINQEIGKSITDLSTNEFALYNNGITILSSETKINQYIGQKQKGQLIIKKPQIINGGQTAFTLSRKLEEAESKGLVDQYFSGKEVLIKIITFQADASQENGDYLDLVEKISQATNQQSPVIESDRRSNEPIQLKIQELIFAKYGYFYERKLGEYADGLKEEYIDKEMIINRDLFLRLCNCCDFKPSEARKTSVKVLFSEKSFHETLNDESRVDEYIFAYECYRRLKIIERKYSRDKHNKYGIINFGNGLRYGKFAIVSACRILFKDEKSISDVDIIVQRILSKWIDFEKWVSAQSGNSTYFTKIIDEESGETLIDVDFDNYYKGSTLNENIKEYFSKEK